MPRKIKVYKNGDLLKEENKEKSITLTHLAPNFWYDNLELSIEENGKETNKVSIPSFKTEHKREILLDIARRYLKPESIKKIIDVMYENKGEFLQLYLSDNKRFGIYSEYLQQTSEVPNNGEYLTKSEVLDIIKYANDRNILVIPNVDSPGHSGKWLSIVKELYPDKTIVSDFDETLVDYWWNDDAYEAIDTLLSEVADLFKQPDIDKNQWFHIGADESSGAESNQPAYVDFINHVAQTVSSKGYIPIIWNDSIYEKGLSRLDRGIEVYYWKKPETGLTAQEFAKDNRDLINCNFYSTTFMPQSKFKDSDIEWQQNYIKEKFNTDLFCEGYEDSNNFIDIGEPLSVRGTALVFWSENSLDLTDEEYLSQALPLIQTYLNA